MRTLSSYLRAHHWIVAVYIVAFPVSMGFVFDWESAMTVLGWALATGWIISAAIEIAALAGTRIRPNAIVDRPTRIFSLTILSVVLLFHVFDLLIRVLSLLRWYGPEASTAFITVLGNGFGDAAYVGLQSLIQWFGLIGVAGLVRALWRREGMTGAGRFVRSIVFFQAFLWGMILFGIVEGSSIALRHWGFDVWSVTWRVIYFNPFLVSLLVVLWYVFLRIARLWVGRVTGIQAAQAFLVSLLFCLLPFIVGHLLFGATIRQGQVMKPVYTASVAMLPFYCWYLARLFSRQRTSVKGESR